MLNYVVACALLCTITKAEPPVQGIRPSNVLGGPEQHASFSFVRPGLTQTSYAFNGPSSHQAFSSSIGNPHLAQRVLPNVAHALAYRNPGLGYFPSAPVSTAYVSSPVPNPGPAVYQAQNPAQAPIDQAAALAYYQQIQQYQAQSAQAQGQTEAQAYQAQAYQAQLAQLLALRQAQAQAQAAQASAQTQQVPEQIQLQQQEQQQPTQNLLGVAYSAAPSVAHVRVNGNGYKFDF